MKRAVASPGATLALWTSAAAFTISFAIWTVFAILGVVIKDEFALSGTQFGLLIGAPILTGSVSRPFLGSWADQIGGRKVFAIVMAAAAIACFLASYAASYPQLLIAALGIGIAGGAFPAGAEYVARLYPPDRQGAALGTFGAGNVGPALTMLFAPALLLTMSWADVLKIWALVLLVAAVLFLLLTKDDPETQEQASGKVVPSMRAQLATLGNLQVWRFAAYYFFVFGASVALAVWLPYYLIAAYELDLVTAGILAAFYAVPASLFRIYGSRLSDRYGVRAVLYWALGASVFCTFMLSYPPTTYIIDSINGPISFRTSLGVIPFLFLIFILGFFMSLGKVAVFRNIPVYYPRHVGSVGGLVGMIGGLGGFFLPFAFGALVDLTGIWTSAFALLFLLFTVALAWMHVSIRHMERQAAPEERLSLPQLPELQGFGEAGVEAAALPAGPIADWQPEDAEFWHDQGRPTARRNLWISTYCLALSFAVWMVWSVVVARLPGVGFAFTTDQLFWLAAIPGVSGATLRIFYAFLVPIFGGRLWTTVSTASLLIPAFGIGYAVQNPETPYLIFLVLAFLCGLGGGNFASSVANISFFFPKREKGSALAINSGLGNLGVSIMQLVVPIVITFSVFGLLGGAAQASSTGEMLWLQNAGFIWVPLIALGTVAAWFGMNDILSAKSSFADQAAIFSRIHTWVMCWLYTGTFGTFIGMSAGFPLLSGLIFPEIDALRYAFIGPLVGALSRAGSGWIADRFGGTRVTLWVFVLMIAAVFGMIWFVQVQSFSGFFAMVLLLFLASGVGNASTFQMVPAIMHNALEQAEPQLDQQERTLRADRESAAVVGFISAISAYGAFYIPKAYGSSIELTGGPSAALWGFMIFYLSCVVVTWLFYARPARLSGPDSNIRRPVPVHADKRANKGSSS